jgi:hypothetical protein
LSLEIGNLLVELLGIDMALENGRRFFFFELRDLLFGMDLAPLDLFLVPPRAGRNPVALMVTRRTSPAIGRATSNPTKIRTTIATN